jgi:hypothetical protein
LNKTTTQPRRPGPLRWLWYTFGGALGPSYRQWVLHDLTSRTRWLRQGLRAIVQVTPLEVVLLLVLGFSWVTGAALICGLALALIYSIAYFDQSAENRLNKHGYPSGTAHRILGERQQANDPDRVRRYIQRYRNGGT